MKDMDGNATETSFRYSLKQTVCTFSLPMLDKPKTCKEAGMRTQPATFAWLGANHDTDVRGLWRWRKQRPKDAYFCAVGTMLEGSNQLAGLAARLKVRKA